MLETQNADVDKSLSFRERLMLKSQLNGDYLGKLTSEKEEQLRQQAKKAKPQKLPRQPSSDQIRI